MLTILNRKKSIFVPPNENREMMLGLFCKGMLIGALVSLPTGPLGILCIQRTIAKGRMAGLMTGLGAIVSDMLYAVLTVFFVGLVVNFVEANQRTLQLVGSAILLVLG